MRTLSKPYVYRVIAVFCLGWVLVYADRTCLYPMLPVIGRDFGLTAAQTGFITSAYFILYVGMQVPAGLLGDRLGLKRVLVALYLVAGLGLLAVGLLATTYVTLLIFVGLYGLGAGAYYSTAYGITMHTVPRSIRGLSSAIVNSGMSLGLALGLATAGPIYLATGNWRVPFLLLAVPTLLVALLFWATLREVWPQPQSRGSLLDILRDRNLMAINFASFCSLYGFWVAVTWGPGFFQTERGLDMGLAGLYTAIIAFAAIPAALAMGRISDRVGRKRLSLLMLPLAALTIFAMAYVRSAEGLLLALVCYGLFGKLAWDPVSVTWLADHVMVTRPGAMGAALGVYSLVAVFSAIVAPPLSGLIKDLTGSLEGAFYLGAAIVALGTVFALIPEETVKPRS